MTQHAEAPVLVTGATGRQGGATARALMRRGVPVRAFVRNPNQAAAQALARSGVEIAVGDLDDVGSLVAAMAGARGVFSVQNWWLTGATREVRQGKNVADAVKKARLPHLLFHPWAAPTAARRSRTGGRSGRSSSTSASSASRPRFCGPSASWKPTTSPPSRKRSCAASSSTPFRADKPYQIIATDDIGEWAALAFTQPDRFVGRALEIAGDELTNPQIAATFARVLGRPVSFRRLPLFVTRIVLGKEFHQMFKWFNEEGYRADLAALRRDHPEVKPTSLEAWLVREGWGTKGTTCAPHAKTFIAKIPRAK